MKSKRLYQTPCVWPKSFNMHVTNKIFANSRVKTNTISTGHKTN